MRVLFIGSGSIEIPPKKGGAVERLTYWIYNHLKKVRFAPVIINTEERREHFNILTKTIFELLFGLRALIKTKEINPKIIHIQTVFTGLPIILMKKTFSKKQKIVYSSHNPSWTADEKEIGKLNILIEKVEAFIMKSTDKVITVSKSMRKGIIKKTDISKEKIQVIYNFVNTEKFSPKYGKKWKLNHNIRDPTVLYVGKLTKTKGINYLLKSVPKIIEKIPEAKFVIVGSTEHGKELEKNQWFKLVKKLDVKENVLFLGGVEEEELPKIYSSADVFVFPSLREAFGLVLLEAMASGLPSVVSKIPVLKEFTNKKCSIFIKRKDSQKLAKALIKLLKNKQLREKMGKLARKKSKKFDKEKILKHYEKFYRKLLEE